MEDIYFANPEFLWLLILLLAEGGIKHHHKHQLTENHWYLYFAKTQLTHLLLCYHCPLHAYDQIGMFYDS